jgi:hypothetical protein
MSPYGAQVPSDKQQKSAWLMKSPFGSPMTLGNAAHAKVRLIV